MAQPKPGVMKPQRTQQPVIPYPDIPYPGITYPGAKYTTAERWLRDNYPPEERYWEPARQAFIRRFGFAIPDTAGLGIIERHQPLLKVGAGLGYWAYELQSNRVDIIATDRDTQARWPGKTPWTPVEKLPALDAIHRYPERNVLICWPDNNDPWASEALRTFKADTIIYVGEEPDGCTGTHEMFHLMRRRFFIERTHHIPRFLLPNDRLQILKRKKKMS